MGKEEGSTVWMSVGEGVEGRGGGGGVVGGFFFNDTATTEIYTLSLHDALPIYDVNQFVNGRVFYAHVVS